MKTNTVFYLIAMTVFIAGCSFDKQSKDGLPYIDVRQNYPEKEIFLTDIANVSYLYLNSDDDDYLYQGSISYITDNTVVVVDNSSGSILFFSKDGTPKSRFNRKGQGPEEYYNSPAVIYDEITDEVFVHGFRVIQVYSSIGEYKRTITLPQGMVVNEMISFDDHSFFFYDFSVRMRAMSEAKLSNKEYIGPPYHLYYRISKTTGEVIDSIKLPATQTFLGINLNGKQQFAFPLSHLTKCPEGVLLSSHGTDTIFLYGYDKSLTPILYQTPSITALNPLEFLDNYVDRGQYQFIKSIVVRRGDESPGIFPAKYYMRNKKTGETVRPKLLLPDYKGKEFVINNADSGAVGEYENGYYFELDLYELKKADRENKVSGKLKELVDTLNEDEDNNVFVLVEFK